MLLGLLTHEGNYWLFLTSSGTSFCETNGEQSSNFCPLPKMIYLAQFLRYFPKLVIQRSGLVTIRSPLPLLGNDPDKARENY